MVLADVVFNAIRKKYICDNNVNPLCIIKGIMFATRSWIFDTEYIPVDEQVLNEALAKWKNEVLSNLVYKPEIWDCDDYASLFKAWLQKYLVFEKQLRINAVGIALGRVYDKKTGELLGGHAWNIVLVNKPVGFDVKFVEPQVGIVFDHDTDTWEYELMAVII